MCAVLVDFNKNKQKLSETTVEEFLFFDGLI